ncbi:hypothetical protein BC567DRAFT_223968 [Phyllosticta citribraziliensis]
MAIPKNVTSSAAKITIRSHRGSRKKTAVFPSSLVWTRPVDVQHGPQAKSRLETQGQISALVLGEDTHF